MPNDPIELLIVDNGCPLPDGVSALLSSNAVRATTVGQLGEVDEGLLAGGLDAALILGMGDQGGEGRDVKAGMSRLAERLSAAQVGVMMMTPEPGARRSVSTFVDWIAPETSRDELMGRLSTMAQYRPLIQRLEQELENMQRLGKQLNHHFTEVDQEMRLASRLQQDFLPKELPTLGGIQAATLFRPASWVSGDIYDVFRIDEGHVGLYSADAVGHGMAAGLLTMFIKRAVVPKRIQDESYTLVPPGDVLAHLNETLKDQNLPNCQFVTACYCVYDVETHVLQVARGGHPYPLRVGIDGSLTEIRSTGGLLGVFPDEEFETVSTRLEPGEKLLLYSDGIEIAFADKHRTAGDEPRFEKGFQAVAKLPARQLVQRLTEMLDSEEGSLNPQDDVTVIVLEVPA